MSTPTFIDTLRVEVATLQAKNPQKLGEIARAHALIVDGHVLPQEDGTGKVLSSDHHTWYHVNGACDCASAVHGKPCKHVSAWWLYKHVAKKQAELAPPPPPPSDPPKDEGVPPPDEEAPSTIPREYLQYLHGKPHVLFKGLLAMAHERGLVSLSATFVSVTPDLAIATATATFADGRTFTESADATPTNVQKGVKDHFMRMALTRAKARCLRDALNIGIAAVEELNH